ncbi:unnamed protein product [Choristocarpus tenellus]
MASVRGLEEVLSDTLSPDNATRRAAEDELKLAAQRRGFACALALHLAQGAVQGPYGTDVHAHGIRLMSGVVLQHYVKDVWKGADVAVLPAEDKAQVRRLMLGTMADGGVKRQVRSSAALVVALVAASGEWPSAWPDLVPTLLMELVESASIEGGGPQDVAERAETCARCLLLMTEESP